MPPRWRVNGTALPLPLDNSEFSNIQIYRCSPNTFTMWRLINHNTKRIIIQMRTEIGLEFEVDSSQQSCIKTPRKTLSVGARSVSSITGTCGQALHIRPYKIKRESIWGWREWWLRARQDLFFVCYRMQPLIDAWKSLRHTLRICHV